MDIKWPSNSLQHPSPIFPLCTLTTAGAIPLDKAHGAAGAPGTQPCSLCHPAEGELGVEGLSPGAAWTQPAQGDVLGGAAPSIHPRCDALAAWRQGPAGGAQALVGAPQVATLKGAGRRRLQALVYI